jgi:hypothetical protein
MQNFFHHGKNKLFSCSSISTIKHQQQAKEDDPSYKTRSKRAIAEEGNNLPYCDWNEEG